jgi:hypothetical protein
MCNKEEGFRSLCRDRWRSPIPLLIAPQLIARLTLGAGHRTITDAWAAGFALAADNAAGVNLGDLDLVERREPLRQSHRHVSIHADQAYVVARSWIP